MKITKTDLLNYYNISSCLNEISYMILKLYDLKREDVYSFSFGTRFVCGEDEEARVEMTCSYEEYEYSDYCDNIKTIYIKSYSIPLNIIEFCGYSHIKNSVLTDESKKKISDTLKDQFVLNGRFGVK